MEWDGAAAHSAVYDTERTAALFCRVVNRWKELTDAYERPSTIVAA